MVVVGAESESACELELRGFEKDIRERVRRAMGPAARLCWARTVLKRCLWMREVDMMIVWREFGGRNIFGVKDVEIEM